MKLSIRTKVGIAVLIIGIISIAFLFYVSFQQAKPDINEFTGKIVDVRTLTYAMRAATLVTFEDGTSLEFLIDYFGQFNMHKGETVHITYYWLINNNILESIEEIR
ncbi:MAG: hypothetical protein IMZ52_00595 [Actinobacteria bacterium]|nr:hypothetical protein [Bacteroidota bacterium]MBE3093499.1 hypothetical protein [Actinomycetota bacterium]